MSPPGPRWNAGDQSWEFPDHDAPMAFPEPRPDPDQDGARTGSGSPTVPGPVPPDAAAARTPAPASRDGAGPRPPLTPPPVPRPPLAPPPVPRHPAVGDPGAGGSGGPARTRRLALPAAGLAAAVLVAVAAVWLGQDDTPSGAASSAAATAFPTASPTVPRSGYRLAEGPDGVTLAVPEDWAHRTNTAAVVYEAADHSSYLEIYPVSFKAEAVELARGFSRGVASVWTGYVETGFGPVGEGPDAAVEVNFGYDLPDGGRRRGIYRVFTTPGGAMYSVQSAGPSTDWPRQRQVMDTMLAGFYVPPSSSSP
ncbi:hypothetical protein ACPXCE_23830 [Streptomyces sp. DT24]|uniref:hypothetical protein n=1 Tax=Streptomyces sp. DT24 TaxID=3416520 RepID=UPI003CEEF950